MMGSKERHFAPLINMSLEELVPVDHFSLEIGISTGASVVFFV